MSSCWANGYSLLLSDAKVYELAERTASYRHRGLSHEQSVQEILDALRDFIIPLRDLKRVAGKRKEDELPFINNSMRSS